MPGIERKNVINLIAKAMDAQQSPAEIYRTLKRNKIGFQLDGLTDSYLKSLNFQVETVFDVGVHKGTSFLYTAFPGKKFVLVDPNPASRKLSARWKKSLDMDFHQFAVGRKSGKAKIYVPTYKEIGRRDARASLAIPIDEAERIETTEEIEVEIITLDKLAEQYPSSPYGLKIDVEGFEHEAISGARKVISKCAFVIVEVSTKNRFAGHAKFSEVISLMGKLGMEPLETLRPFQKENLTVDILFLPATSRLVTNAGQAKP